ncbi:hypothetical protein C2E23DRAFT_25569 [Lenzites betulinus]|nr:hypothetical protein C2E23DRAFT_25569 [Lenzites betulinus]
MEQCRIPIEVCERVIDSVGPLEDRERPTTLLRCALTCRAWHFRARRCLWGGPLYIHGAHRFNIFVAGLRHTPDFLTSHVQTLVLHDDSPPASTPGVHPTLYRLNEFLFTRRLPNLRNLELRALKDSSLDLLQGTRVLRMGLSLPTGLTTLTLTLTECPSFSNSVCNIHDVIRACQNLVSLVISFSDQAHGSESRGIQPHGLNVDTYAGSTRNHSWRHLGPPCGTLQNLVVHCRGHDVSQVSAPYTLFQR